jgi:hypothetical protein
MARNRFESRWGYQDKPCYSAVFSYADFFGYQDGYPARLRLRNKKDGETRSGAATCTREVMGCVVAHRKSAEASAGETMQQTVAVRFLAGTLTLALGVCAVFAAPAGAQPQPSLDAVIAPGDPPLTERIVERQANLRAWILEVPLTKKFLAYQRADLTEIWSNPQSAKGVLLLLDAVPQLTPENLAFFRVGAQENALADLRTKSDPASQFYLASFAAAHPSIAPGNPPLTASMASRYVEFVAWLLEIPVTPALEAIQRVNIVRSWKNPADVANFKSVLQAQRAYADMKGGALQRDYARTVDQPVVIAQLRAHRQDPDNRVLLAAFDRAHPSLTAGRPALTRQMSDAWTELYCFISNQGLGEHLVADQNKDAFAASLTRLWPKFSAAQRNALSVMPSRWAGVRWLWSISPPADQAKIVADWMPAVNPQAAAAQRAANGNAAIAAAGERAKAAAATGQYLTTKALMFHPAYDQMMRAANPYYPFGKYVVHP